MAKKSKKPKQSRAERISKELGEDFLKLFKGPKTEKVKGKKGKKDKKVSLPTTQRRVAAVLAARERSRRIREAFFRRKLSNLRISRGERRRTELELARLIRSKTLVRG